MAELMTKEELEAFYEKLSALTKSGTEDEVREYIDYYYPRLPENVRQELLFHTLVDAVRQTAAEENAIAQVQEEGLAAADQLEKLKAELQREEKQEKAENP